MRNKKLQELINLAKEAEESNSYFSAAIYYKDALSEAVKLGDSKSIKLCKSKVVDMNKKAVESGEVFHDLEIPFELSERDRNGIESFIKGMLKIESAQKLLQTIGKHPEFIPKLKSIEAQSQHIPIAYQFATLSSISESGHSVRGGSQGEYSWFMQMYDINQKLILEFMLSRIMYMTTSKDSKQARIKLADMKDYFSKSGLIPSENLETIMLGLERYYAEDYVSALHILVPQFEAFFLSVAQSCGISTVALDTKKDIATRTITLSDTHLDSEEFKNVFGEDFCRQIKFVLYEPMGYKLRHKIAHGEIKYNECNFQNVTLILYFYLVILAKASVKE